MGRWHPAQGRSLLPGHTWHHPWLSSEKCRAVTFKLLAWSCVFPVHQASSWMHEAWRVLVTSAFSYFVTFVRQLPLSLPSLREGRHNSENKRSKFLPFEFKRRIDEQIGPLVLKTGKSPPREEKRV